MSGTFAFFQKKYFLLTTALALPTAVLSFSACSPSLLNSNSSLVSCKLSDNWSQLLDYSDSPTTIMYGSGDFFFSGSSMYSTGVDQTGWINASKYLVSTDQGNTWASTGPKWQYVSGKSTYISNTITDLSGNLYSTGWAADAGDIEHWIIRKSTNGGASWTLINDYQFTAGQHADGYGILAGLDGALYATGVAADGTAGNGTGGLQYKLYTRKSVNGGATWTIVDTFEYAPGYAVQVAIIEKDLEGNIYVAGVAKNGALRNFFVRKSSNAGATWATVDDYNYAGQTAGWPSNLRINSAGHIYLVTYAGYNGVGARSRMLVRRSIDKGATWSDFFDYQLDPLDSTYGSDIAFAPNGDMYVSGDAYSPTEAYWIVLKYSATTKAWSFSDKRSFDQPAGDYGTPYAMGFNQRGDLLVNGLTYAGATGQINWAMRKLPCF